MATPLSFYPRPPIDTGIGMHDSHLTGDNPPDIRQHARNLRKAGVSWYKILAGGVNKVERVRIYAQEGIMSIVRLYVERPHPNYIPNRDEVAQYVAAGGKYIEAGNEQNLLDETTGGINPEAVAAQWIRASDVIKSVGGIPVVYACTPGGHMNHRTYTNRFLAEVKRLGRLDSFDKAVLGIHPRPLNNPPDQPRDTGNPPNTTTWNEWTWYDEAYYNYLGWHIPLAATEHGYSGRGQENSEHPPMNDTTWAEWNKELCYRFNPSHPKAVSAEFLAICYWLEVNHGVWIYDAPFARDGREWIGDAPRQDDRLWGKALWTIQPNWNRVGATPPNPNPVPPNPTPTPPLPDRVVINKPPYVSFVEPTVQAGSDYYELTRFKFVDEAEARGKHAIYILDPHN